MTSTAASGAEISPTYQHSLLYRQRVIVPKNQDDAIAERLDDSMVSLTELYLDLFPKSGLMGYMYVNPLSIFTYLP